MKKIIVRYHFNWDPKKEKQMGVYRSEEEMEESLDLEQVTILKIRYK